LDLRVTSHGPKPAEHDDAAALLSICCPSTHKAGNARRGEYPRDACASSTQRATPGEAAVTLRRHCAGGGCQAPPEARSWRFYAFSEPHWFDRTLVRAGATNASPRSRLRARGPPAFPQALRETRRTREAPVAEATSPAHGRSREQGVTAVTRGRSLGPLRSQPKPLTESRDLPPRPTHSLRCDSSRGLRTQPRLPTRYDRAPSQPSGFVSPRKRSWAFAFRALLRPEIRTRLQVRSSLAVRGRPRTPPSTSEAYSLRAGVARGAKAHRTSNALLAFSPLRLSLSPP
jgi:hypothetical protein